MSCGKVMFPAVYVSHSVHGRGRGDIMSLISHKLHEINPSPPHHTGTQTHPLVMFKLVHMDLAIHGLAWKRSVGLRLKGLPVFKRPTSFCFLVIICLRQQIGLDALCNTIPGETGLSVEVKIKIKILKITYGFNTQLKLCRSWGRNQCYDFRLNGILVANMLLFVGAALFATANRTGRTVNNTIQGRLSLGSKQTRFSQIIQIWHFYTKLASK